MDSKDQLPEFLPEDLSHNDIESISEFVSEVMFGAENTFAEHEENDGDCSHEQTSKNVMISIAPTALEFSFETACVRYYVMNSRFVNDIYTKIKVPPPQRSHS
ncbi:hypothetical protein [Pseudochryseolinea flava]|uniref:Uncharacterized protein n=1 Tax=Pseudochryseolinea flava TaxID=2059302 RepID=A0A364XYR4_9BACT|nr:hypothetical protein [Pseudochryseolinea flava]RAV98735.1 hypothetical protein DQQ10_22220 [Pseudochryseolinea flava]